MLKNDYEITSPELKKPPQTRPNMALETDGSCKSQGTNITQMHLLATNNLDESQMLSLKKNISKFDDSPDGHELIIQKGKQSSTSQLLQGVLGSRNKIENA